MALGSLVLASCTGASTTPPGPSPAPTMTATLPPQTLVPTTGGTVTLPAAANGQTASLAFAAGAPPNILISATSSTAAPGSAPAPSSTKRAAAALFGAVPFFWVTFTVTGTLPPAAITGASVTLAGQPPDTEYYSEFDDVTTGPGVKLASAGPGTVASGAATIAGAGPSLTSGHTYLLQFYYISLSTTPSPSPSAAPSPSPSPTATATGGGTPTPAPSGSATPTPTPTPVPTPTGPATPVPTYTFSGSSGTATCTTASCTPLSLLGGALTVQFGAASATATVSGSTATGLSQISPSGFPVVLTSGTVEQYLAISSSAAVTFAQTPQITLTSLTGVSSCILYAYTNNGTAYNWAPIAPATGGATVSGGTVVIPPVTITSGTVNLQTAPPFYGAIICQ